MILWLSGCGGSGTDYVYTDSGGYPVLAGRASFERLLPTAALHPDSAESVETSLDFASPIMQPVRYARVELLDKDDRVLRSGVTDGQGNFLLEVPFGDGPVRVRLYSETIAIEGLSAPISVRDNTQGGAVYAVDSEPLVRQSQAVELAIDSGYDQVGGQPGPSRPSAPFACLDAVLTGYQYMLEGGLDPSELPLCKVNWSQHNRPEPGETEQGQIGTSHFSPWTNEIFILGFREADTDEFDWHIVIHEFGHWVQFNAFRNDSLGGPHSGGQHKDPRLTFSEGFGNAFGALALGDPIYKDTSTPTGRATSLECNGRFSGWFSELSVAVILYDLFDPVRLEAGASNFDDRIELDRSVFVSALSYQRSSSALTTIFSFLEGVVRSGLSAQESEGVMALLQRESTSVDYGINSLDEFARGETHNGGIYPLPLYTDLTTLISQAPTSLFVSVGGQEDEHARNWLSGVRFYTFVGDGRDLTITARNSASTVGAIMLELYENGTEVASEGELEAPFEDAEIEGTFDEGAVYVLVLVNVATETSTTELVFSR